MKQYNFFEKIYWGWKQVYYNFDEWCWVVSGKNDEFDAPVTLDLFIGLNLNYRDAKDIADSFFTGDRPQAGLTSPPKAVTLVPNAIRFFAAFISRS